jgi:hypothetical protein
MLESLLDILSEILGLGGNEQPVSRQRQPQRPQGQRQPQRAAAPSLEDMIRKMAGAEEAPPPQQQPQPKRGAGRAQQPRERSRADVPASARAAMSAPRPMAVSDVASVPAQERARAGADALAALRAELRSDPGAARRAFVYSEIFGRPLGDR